VSRSEPGTERSTGPEAEHPDRDSESTSPPASLGERVPRGGTDNRDEIFDLFYEWATDAGFELYPAQEEAVLELMADRHVILSTPTGSGKSLVALGLHFRALCEGARCFYTSPIKALASEKFFALCDELGPDRVGMLTGDASINPSAPIVCCTAEVLANLALRQGSRLELAYVVMDEFHFYSDPDRGSAWQIPLITLPNTRFLLMSATLGDMSKIVGHLERQTAFAAVEVSSHDRPVPLDFDYRETPLHESIAELIESGLAPIYVVNFTQRECAEVAQALTSTRLTSRDERDRIRDAVGDTRFATPYGREFKRFISFGIGVHHAGLLPKYRLQVERLAQQGLLKVISGTDTLGVGVNIPIRTVLFTGLAKFDGRKFTQLKVREFQQIAGRAGRKGFDDRGSVVCQAPEDVVERRQSERQGKGGGKKRRKQPKRQAQPGRASWSQDTFRRLIDAPPEVLRSRFRVTTGMILDLLQRDAELNDPDAGNFASLRKLIDDCHEKPGAKGRLLSRAADLTRSLYRAGIIRMERDVEAHYMWIVVRPDLQVEFSLFHTLSLFLVTAIEALDDESPDYALDLVSIVEAVLEDPAIVLRRQADRIKGILIAQLKAEGVSYEERMARLDEVEHPQPCAEFIWAIFSRFRITHPWVGAEILKPKSIGREMLEEYLSFGEYVRRLGLQRSEGVLLRYLSQLYKTLHQNVPDSAKTDAVWDVIGYFRAMIERTDSSLIEEWEALLHPELRFQGVTDSHAAHRMLVADELIHDSRALAARLRAELHQLVRALARQDWEEAVQCVRPQDPESGTEWDAERFEAELAPYFAEHSEIVFDHRARLADKTQINRIGELRWRAVQILVDPADENLWCIETEVDLSKVDTLDGPLIAMQRIGC
jgi:superfamily II RNA helicase